MPFVMGRVLTTVFMVAGAAAVLIVPSRAADEPPAEPPRFRAGRIEAAEVAECSGLVASRRHAGVFWAICDSGNAAELYALTREGKLLAAFPVDARNVDWEDLAIDDDGHLYIAETGNNERRRRPAVVYQLDEPDPAKPPAADGKSPPLPIKKTFRRDFPEPTDCEALFVYKRAGYLITKNLKAQPAILYSFDLSTGPGPEKLTKVAALPVRTPVTAADVSVDGKWLAVLTVTGPTLFRIDGDVAAAGKAAGKSVFYVSPNMESCCFVKEGLLVATEGRDVFLFKWADFGISADADDAR
jgi:hypothetical protein